MSCAALHRRKLRIHQPWPQPRTWPPGAQSASRASPCGELVTAASFLAQLLDLCLLAQRVRGYRATLCRLTQAAEPVWKPNFFFSSTYETDLYGALGTALSSRKELLVDTSITDPSMTRCLRGLNASISEDCASALLQAEDTVKPCGNLAGFVPQRRRWPKIS